MSALQLGFFFRLCCFMTRQMHDNVQVAVIQHPYIPHEAAWRRLREAYGHVVTALTGKGAGHETVADLPQLARQLADAADAMQQEIATSDWGTTLFPAPATLDLGGDTIRRYLDQMILPVLDP